MYINFKNLGAQATFLKAQKNFVVVNRGGGGGEGGRGVRKIGKDRCWNELWKFKGGVWGQRCSMRY